MLSTYTSTGRGIELKGIEKGIACFSPGKSILIVLLDVIILFSLLSFNKTVHVLSISALPVIELVPFHKPVTFISKSFSVFSFGSSLPDGGFEEAFLLTVILVVPTTPKSKDNSLSPILVKESLLALALN